MRLLHVAILIPLTLAQLRLSNSTYSVPLLAKPQTATNSSLTCHDIRTVPPDNQCIFAQQYCGEYKIGFVNYVELYYCGHFRWLRLLSYLTVLTCLFTTLGITASEFLCPNLDTLAKFLRLSESLAGVTLLALGNGSPDVFSTLEAMKIGSSDLAIGELMGAALFITGVVVGSMAIVRPFKVAKRPFVRDILFLLASVLITGVFLSDGEISLFEAVVMIILYSTYVIFVVFWDWWVTKSRRIQLTEQRVRNQFSDGHTLQKYQVAEQNEVNDDDLLAELTPSSGINVLDQQLQDEAANSFDEWTRRSDVQRIRPSILGALDLNARAQGYQNVPPQSAISLDTLPENIIMSSAPHFTDEELSVGEYEARTQSAPAEFGYDNVPDFLNAHHSIKAFLKHKKWSHKNLINAVFPTLTQFNDKSISDKVITLISLPAVTMLRLTVPVINTENKEADTKAVFGREFFLLVLQCFFSPVITMILTVYDGGFTAVFILVPAFVSIVLLMLAFAVKGATVNGAASVPRYVAFILSMFGFIISISWISTIATELIAIIKFFAVLFDLSDAILGVTVFAVGNSLGDFISNFTIAKMGFPMMALSACFGGPLLNVLLGIGGSALYVIPITGENIQVHVSSTLLVTSVALVVNLVSLLVIVPMNGWEINRSIGVAMISLWSGATAVCCIMEMF